MKVCESPIAHHAGAQNTWNWNRRRARKELVGELRFQGVWAAYPGWDRSRT
jgi:hypothetical protein